MIFKKEFISELAEKIGMTKKDTEYIYDSVFDVLVAQLERGEDVAINNLGRFKIVEAGERHCRNPRTGEAMVLEAHKNIKFVPLKNLKDAVKKL